VLGLILILGVLGLLFYRSRKRNNSAAQQQTRDEVFQPGSPSDRFSHYTGTTPGGGNEMSSEGKTTPTLGHWLSSQESGVCAFFCLSILWLVLVVGWFIELVERC